MGSLQKALNLGCGNDYRKSTPEIEWVNADNGKCNKDQFLNIEWRTWPFENDTFDRIDAIQVLEHCSKTFFPQCVSEMYRISKDGATWNIAVPHGFSDNFITDPTHKMPFSLRTFDYWVDDTDLRENGIIYGWGDIHLKHQLKPALDGNQSVLFTLKVVKFGTNNLS